MEDMTPGAVSVFGEEAVFNRELLGLVRAVLGTSVQLNVWDIHKNAYSYGKEGKGPGIQYAITGAINDKGTYTIVEMNGSWGRLKSGAGWIALEYVKQI